MGHARILNTDSGDVRERSFAFKSGGVILVGSGVAVVIFLLFRAHGNKHKEF